MAATNVKRKPDPGESVGYRKCLDLSTQPEQNKALQAFARVSAYDAELLASGKNWSSLQMLLDGFSEHSEELMVCCKQLLKNAGKHDRVQQANDKKMTLTKVAHHNITEDLKIAAHLVKYYSTLSKATHNSCGPVVDCLTWDQKQLREGCDGFISRIETALAQRSKHAKVSTPGICMVPPQVCAPAYSASSSAKAEESVVFSAPGRAAVVVQSNKPACAGDATDDLHKAFEHAQNLDASNLQKLVQMCTALQQTRNVGTPKPSERNMQTPHSQRQLALGAVFGETKTKNNVKRSEDSNDNEGEPGNVKAWHNNAWHPNVKATIANVHAKKKVDVETLNPKALDALRSLPYEVALVCLNKRINETGRIKDESQFIIKNCQHLINQWGLDVSIDDDCDRSEDDDSDEEDGSSDEDATEHDGDSSGVAASHGERARSK
jgi:hypothetical protein